MRKHGWRTPQRKPIRALEPDFQFNPPVELYNLIEDPLEASEIAADHPEVVDMLTGRMELTGRTERWIAVWEDETGLPNPIYCQGEWHGHEGSAPSSPSKRLTTRWHISLMFRWRRGTRSIQSESTKDSRAEPDSGTRTTRPLGLSQLVVV